MERLNRLTMVVSIGLAAASLALTGCVTKSAADAQARAAFIAGEKRGIASQKDSNFVWVVGNVKIPLVPWTQDLTLAKAIVAANYLGVADPSQIGVFRNGEAPVFVNPRQILKGFDMPLLAGDRVEIRP